MDLNNHENSNEGFYHVDDVIIESIEKQIEKFRAKFGRDPGPDDPLFFDPDFDTPTQYSEEKLWSRLLDDIDKHKEGS